MALQDQGTDTNADAVDWAGDGLFDQHSGELRPGFAIEATDIVLDVGCGRGTDALFCAQRGAAVVYVDKDAEAVDATGRRLTGAGARALTPIVSDCNPLPVANGTATKIVASEVLEYVEDPAQFLRELARAGAPGALYLLAVSDPIQEELRVDLTASAPEMLNRARIIGRHEFARMVTDAGLVIERRGFYGFYWAIRNIVSSLCRIDSTKPHPILQSWEETWQTLLGMPNSGSVRTLLANILPKNQYILARKPVRASAGTGGLGTAFRSIRTLLAGSPGPVVREEKPAFKAVGAGARLSDPVAPVPINDAFDAGMVGLYDAFMSGWFRFEQSELFQGFPVAPDDVVLDVGCGDGGFAAACAKMGAQVIFTDIDPDKIAEATRQVAAVATRDFLPIVNDTNPLPLADQSVSRIISVEVIERVDDPAAFLHELARVGKPGARYLLATVDPLQESVQRELAPPELFMRPDAGAKTIRGLPSGVLHTISRDTFERIVSSAGLVVERTHYVSFYWALWFAFFWICNVDFQDPRHPLLVQWARTWQMILDSPEGYRVKQRLDVFMPRSQIIVAWKP